MRSPFGAASWRRAALAVLAGSLACGRPAPTSSPGAEFLVSAGDSTYWVRSAGGGIRLRSSPILLVSFDGRFHEVYVTDEDRSYEDAVFIGQRLWRRDLVRGDSVLVFEDTLVPSLSRRWAALHPGARLLAPNEPEPDDPAAAASVELSVIAAHGPYLSFEYHADVEAERATPWHATRRGVIDLRSGHQAEPADLVGADAGRAAVAAGRRGFAAMVDSLLRSGDDGVARAAESLDGLAFDPSSLTIEGDAGAPRLAFFVPAAGEGELGGFAIPVEPVAVAAPPWWRALTPTLPVRAADSSVARWDHGPYAVTATPGTDREELRLDVAGDGPRRVGTVQSPVHQIFWLDRPAVDSATRRSLVRAFDEAVFYDETTRTAAHDARTRSPVRHAQQQDRPREPARILRAHDAAGCQQPGPRVRRRDPLDDGQGGGDRRLPALAGQRGHRVDRPGGLPRADPRRGPRGDEGQRQLCGPHVDGSRGPRRG